MKARRKIPAPGPDPRRTIERVERQRGKLLPRVTVERVMCPECGSFNHRFRRAKIVGSRRDTYVRCKDCGEHYIIEARPPETFG